MPGFTFNHSAQLSPRVFFSVSILSGLIFSLGIGEMKYLFLSRCSNPALPVVLLEELTPWYGYYGPDVGQDGLIMLWNPIISINYILLMLLITCSVVAVRGTRWNHSYSVTDVSCIIRVRVLIWTFSFKDLIC